MSRVHAGEKVTDLCIEYGVSRKTGHKIKKRYDELGKRGLEDQSRAPKNIPHKTPPEVVALVVQERKKHPSWGPRKLKDVLEQRLGRRLPAASTLGDILERFGLTERRRRCRPRYQPMPTPLTQAKKPNDVWCVDYKGQFRLGNREYCYPLTITDLWSRSILGCDAMPTVSERDARDAMEIIFREQGLPSVIRSDNGVPFSSTGLAGLSKLSVYWMRLGIKPERTRPGHPQDNGQHERMHRTLKQETTRPARTNLLQQQETFDAFVDEFNNERPHEALGMKRPAQLYRRSKKRHPKVLDELEYPTHDDTLHVYGNGNLRLATRGTIYLAAALADENVGIREEKDGRLLVSFMDLNLGHILHDNTFEPASVEKAP